MKNIFKHILNLGMDEAPLTKNISEISYEFIFIFFKS
jgi:hypothetical protein